jgi:hypothetical protein
VEALFSLFYVSVRAGASAKESDRIGRTNPYISMNDTQSQVQFCDNVYNINKGAKEQRAIATCLEVERIQDIG